MASRSSTSVGLTSLSIWSLWMNHSVSDSLGLKRRHTSCVSSGNSCPIYVEERGVHVDVASTASFQARDGAGDVHAV